MENNNTDISFSPTISKQIRTALFDIMQDGGVYPTSEIRTQMEKRFNLAYKRDYNINHFWGVINSLLKSDKLKRKNNAYPNTEKGFGKAVKNSIRRRGTVMLLRYLSVIPAKMIQAQA